MQLFHTKELWEFREVYHIPNDYSKQEHFPSTLRHKLAHFEMVKN